jgi:hypothetical protein
VGDADRGDSRQHHKHHRSMQVLSRCTQCKAQKVCAPAASGWGAGGCLPAHQADCWADAGPAAGPQRALLGDCARQTRGVLHMASVKVWVQICWCVMQFPAPANCHSASTSQQAIAIPQQTWLTGELAALAVMLVDRALGLHGSWVLLGFWPLYPCHRRLSLAII